MESLSLMDVINTLVTQLKINMPHYVYFRENDWWIAEGWWRKPVFFSSRCEYADCLYYEFWENARFYRSYNQTKQAGLKSGTVGFCHFLSSSDLHDESHILQIKRWSACTVYAVCILNHKPCPGLNSILLRSPHSPKSPNLHPFLHLYISMCVQDRCRWYIPSETKAPSDWAVTYAVWP